MENPVDSPETPEARAVARAARLIEAHPELPHTLESLAGHVGLSGSRLHREFVRVYGVTPHKYQRAVRAGLLRDELRGGASVTRAGFESGFGSSRAIYEHGCAALGMAPSVYRGGGRGQQIAWAIGDTRLGPVVVGATSHGVCCVLFAEESAAEPLLRAEFPEAGLRADRDARGHLSDVVALLDGQPTPAEVPLDLLGTPFQREVWAELRRIPPGATASYAQVAQRVGRPAAVRAVANACAGNHAAVVVPCHRVLRSDGGLGGYRWGTDRKSALLEREREGSAG
jgi:AraC family transcriptional regulator of adaptative response/methylated-DNA-[protein]-cysteine methyltransferase